MILCRCGRVRPVRQIVFVSGVSTWRELRKFAPIVDQINAIYATLDGLSDDELRGNTARFRATITEHTAALKAKIAAWQPRPE